MLYLILGSIVIATIIYLATRKKFLPDELVTKSCNKIQRTSKLDPNHSLMESHKILIETIRQMNLSKKLSAAQVLNKVAKRLSDEKQVWIFHRMRNKAAHELDFQVSAEEAKQARKIFKQSLKTLIKK